MKKILIALVATTAFSAMALTMSDTADARWGYAGYRGVGYHGGYRLRYPDSPTVVMAIAWATVVTATATPVTPTPVTATVATMLATVTLVTATVSAMRATVTLFMTSALQLL